MTAFVLWITVLSGPLDGVTYGIPYQTEEACRAAKRALLSVRLGGSLKTSWN